jgi:hypothetical protein
VPQSLSHPHWPRPEESPKTVDRAQASAAPRTRPPSLKGLSGAALQAALLERAIAAQDRYEARALTQTASEADDERPPPPELEYEALPPNSRRDERRRKKEARDERWRTKYLDKMQAAGIAREDVPPQCPESVYRMVQSVLSDDFGRKTPKIIEREARLYTGYPFACLRTEIGDAPDFRDPDTRFVVAGALLLLKLSKRGRRKGRWQSLVRGHGIGNLAAILHAPGNPSAVKNRNSVGGGGTKRPEHRLAAASRRWDGSTPARTRTRPDLFSGRKQSRPLLRRLRDCGFLYAQQLPAACVAGFERDKRHAHAVRNRYWLAGLTTPGGSRRRRASGSMLSGVLGELTREWASEFNAGHAAGWEWIDTALGRKPDTPPPD